jgi:hypothetical protein
MQGTPCPAARHTAGHASLAPYRPYRTSSRRACAPMLPYPKGPPEPKRPPRRDGLFDVGPPHENCTMLEASVSSVGGPVYPPHTLRCPLTNVAQHHLCRRPPATAQLFSTNTHDRSSSLASIFSQINFCVCEIRLPARNQNQVSHQPRPRPCSRAADRQRAPPSRYHYTATDCRTQTIVLRLLRLAPCRPSYYYSSLIVFTDRD